MITYLKSVPCERCAQFHVGYWRGRVVGACELTRAERGEIDAEYQAAQHEQRDKAAAPAPPRRSAHAR